MNARWRRRRPRCTVKAVTTKRPAIFPEYTPRDQLVAWLLWPALFLASTALFLTESAGVRPSHATLTYLLVVVGATASGKRPLGLLLVIASYAAFHFGVMPSYMASRYFGDYDWLILVAYATVAFAISELVGRWSRAAEHANQRADEIERLAAERERLLLDAQHAEALREADKLKSALLASVSHDLRTPLTAIKALAGRPGGPTPHDARVIEAEADRLGRLLDAVLDWSRIQGGALPSRVEFNTADDLLDAARRAAASALGDRPVHVRIDDEGVLAGHFDLVLSVRIISNLLENAAKYSPASEPVELWAERMDDKLVVGVRDMGAGVPEAERDRVFEPFARGRAVTPDSPGVGLGLAIALQFARAQGGDLVYATSPAGGAEFRLLLPLARASGELSRTGADGGEAGVDQAPVSGAVRISAVA